MFSGSCTLFHKLSPKHSALMASRSLGQKIKLPGNSVESSHLLFTTEGLSMSLLDEPRSVGMVFCFSTKMLSLYTIESKSIVFNYSSE